MLVVKSGLLYAGRDCQAFSCCKGNVVAEQEFGPLYRARGTQRSLGPRTPSDAVAVGFVQRSNELGLLEVLL